MSIDSFTGLINGVISEPAAGLWNGILFGAKAIVDPTLTNDLKTTGAIYILTMFGVKISVLAGLAGLLFRRFLRRPIANLASVAIIIGFVWLIGVSPGVLRAAIMATISLLAVTFGRQKWPILAWILAVATLLLLNPLWIADLSFQLSAAASLGIILFGNRSTNAGRRTFSSTVTAWNLSAGPVAGFPPAPPTKGTPAAGGPPTRATRRIVESFDGCAAKSTPTSAFVRYIWPLIKDDLRMSLAAQAFTIPIIMFQLHRISLVAPLTNLLIGLLLVPTMILGYITVLLGFIWWPLGQIAAWFAWVFLEYIIIVVHLTAKIPFASIQW